MYKQTNIYNNPRSRRCHAEKEATDKSDGVTALFLHKSLQFLNDLLTLPYRVPDPIPVDSDIAKLAGIVEYYHTASESEGSDLANLRHTQSDQPTTNRT